MSIVTSPSAISYRASQRKVSAKPLTQFGGTTSSELIAHGQPVEAGRVEN